MRFRKVSFTTLSYVGICYLGLRLQSRVNLHEIWHAHPYTLHMVMGGLASATQARGLALSAPVLARATDRAPYRCVSSVGKF